MNRINMAFQDLMKKSPAFRITINTIRWGLGIFFLIVLLRTNFCVKKEFVPYSAKVVSHYIDWYKQGGVYYQSIELDNGKRMIANAFSAIVDGKKTRLIDYIAVGDSVVRNTWETIIVYREGAETYVFKHDPKDFKVGER